MEHFAGYGFNKSHSTAYAYLAYQTAYLKTHYPVEFMAALLTSETSKPDNVVKYLGECRELGFDVVEVAGELRVGLGTQYHAPGQCPVRHVVHLRRGRQRDVAGDAGGTTHARDDDRPLWLRRDVGDGDL